MNKLAAVAAIIFLLQLSLTAAIEESRETIFGSEELLIGVELSSSFSLVPEKSDYSAGYARVNLTLFPKESSLQQVEFTKLQPTPEVTDDYLLFEWSNPGTGKLSYNVASDVTTRNAVVPITAKVGFPITNLDEGLEEYTLPSKNIDSDDRAIVELASSLAAGEDDLFLIVYKLAEWSNSNIHYNLSTLTADVTKPASWVLENREGVCDEFTNLFIALNRALGIPARFVSGISYTDSELFAENWGFHGWAEVYFPGYGWVPFDVTYGEFGFVDPGHIKMTEAADVSDTTTNYQWSGRNIKLETGRLTQEITLKRASGRTESAVSVYSKILKDVVGFGSYNIEEVEVTNLRNYYTVAEILHANTESLELIGSNKRDLLLKPGQKKHEYFVFKVDEGLDEGYIYTFPLTVVSHIVSANSSFKSNRDAPKFSLEEVNSLRLEEKEEKAYSRNINLKCSAENEEIYIYESTGISCEVKNAGNVALNNLYFCYDGECELFTLGITRSREFGFSANFTSPGINRVKVKVDSDTVSKSEIVEINVMDEPSVIFQNVSYPELVSFKEVFEISFIAKKVSSTTPLDAEIAIKPTKAVFNAEKLESSRKFTAELSALDMKEGQNNLIIAAEFNDRNGRLYSAEEEIIVEVEKPGFFQKIQRFFLRLFR
ncbi:transglutaminase domain-containing protein [Candidatus Woesearchaeota archaeon]|nr:transglutaminase domain-containing protein [Candidatus Woesearchaeota archaeon]